MECSRYMAMQQIEKFVLSPTFVEHGYLASQTTKTLEILFVCTLLSY